MSLKGVDSSLKSIAREFSRLEAEREMIIKGSRDVTTICRKAIGDIHGGKNKESMEKLGNANTLLVKLRQLNPSLRRYLVPPETEFVEAYTLYNILNRTRLPSQGSLNVEDGSYLLGLLDAIGEVKRLVYDSIRRGENKRAIELFDDMEAIYLALTPFAIYDHLTHGLKKKLDVARVLVENVRAAVTEDVRRSEFIKAVTNLSDRLPSPKKDRKKSKLKDMK